MVIKNNPRRFGKNMVILAQLKKAWIRGETTMLVSGITYPLEGMEGLWKWMKENYFYAVYDPVNDR